MDLDRSAENEKLHENPDAAVAQKLAAEARRKVVRLISKREKLITSLNGDLTRHGDPEAWKKLGDLVLANITTAVRDGDRLRLVDYFDPLTPTIEVEADRNTSLNQLAEGYFRRYAKARNAGRLIAERLEGVAAEIASARKQVSRIDSAEEACEIEYLQSLIAPSPKPIFVSRKKKVDTEFKGARRFISSDSLEILVGKKAGDNDFLTFRVAKSVDLWLHAADYPGSHVVVRSVNRQPVPDRTLVEAAQLAAFYSDARQQPKAAVNYTLKKFVNKPRRSAPGLVSLASFKTILVEPKIAVELAGGR